LDGCLDDGVSALAELLGELDDQNAVLAGEADQHDQTDLAVDVVLQSAQSLSADCAKDGHRDGQQDNEGQAKALILCRQGQIDDEQAESEEQSCGTSGANFLERQSGPFIRDAPGENLRREVFHVLNCLSGAAARSGGSVDLDRAEEIVMADHLCRGG